MSRPRLPRPKPNHEAARPESILAAIRAMRPAMTPKAGRLADFILGDPDKVMTMSLGTLSETAGVGQGLIGDLCRRLGLCGLHQLQIALAQEHRPSRLGGAGDLSSDDDLATIIAKSIQAGINDLHDTLADLRMEEMQRAVDILHSAKRIELYGVGVDAPVAKDAHYRLVRLGFPATVTIDSRAQEISASRTDASTAVVTVCESGRGPESIAVMRLARATGAQTILITGARTSSILQYADVVLHTRARQSPISGKAMASNIAALAVVDALAAASALARFDVAMTILRRTRDVLADHRVGRAKS